MASVLWAFCGDCVGFDKASMSLGFAAHSSAVVVPNPQP